MDVIKEIDTIWHDINNELAPSQPPILYGGAIRDLIGGHEPRDWDFQIGYHNQMKTLLYSLRDRYEFEPSFFSFKKLKKRIATYSYYSVSLGKYKIAGLWVDVVVSTQHRVSFMQGAEGVPVDLKSSLGCYDGKALYNYHSVREVWDTAFDRILFGYVHNWETTKARIKDIHSRYNWKISPEDLWELHKMKYQNQLEALVDWDDDVRDVEDFINTDVGAGLSQF